MQILHTHKSSRLTGAVLLLALLPLAQGAQAQTVLSDNLNSASGGTVTATGASEFASSFTTDASGYTLDSITLLAQEATPGSAVLSLYTDGGLQPGTLVGVLTSPASYPSTLADTTFTAGNLSLAADSTYWAVLSAPTGAYDWSTSSDYDSGLGTGFTNTWDESDDGGLTWFSNNSYQTQMNVTASASPVPEASSVISFGLLLAALPLGAMRRAKRTA